MSDAHLVQLGLDSTGVAVLEEELVGNDEGALLTHDGASSSSATGVEPFFK